MLSTTTGFESAGGIFLERLRLALDAPSVLFNEDPVFRFGFFSPVGNAEASGECEVCGWKMGSPSSSNKLPVLTSQIGYFLDGLTSVAKLESVIKEASLVSQEVVQNESKKML